MDSVDGRPETAYPPSSNCHDHDASVYGSHSGREKPPGDFDRAFSRMTTETRRSTLRLTRKAMASLKAVRAVFSKRYPSLESYIDHVFCGYDEDEDGFLNVEQLATMLKDFHREFAIEVSMKEEILLAEYLVTLCSGSKCTAVNPAKNESWVNEDSVSSGLPSFGVSKHSMWGLCTSYVSITGYVLLGLLVFGYTIASKTILYILKMTIFVPKSCVARLNTFDAFYWSHIVMAVSFVIILLLHPLPGLPSLDISTGSIAWVFLALPILLYSAQILHLAYNRLRSRSHIISSEALPGGVTMIEFPTPKGMRPCSAGQYVQISIGAISQLEIHPFTLSGCPAGGILRLHIKALGDWTRHLYELATDNKLQGSTIHALGPFTTRSNEVAKYDDIILVGAGIGATPFTSILEQSLKHKKAEKKTVHFNWLVREQQAAQTWFHDLIQSIEDSNSNLNIRATIWYTGGKVGDSPVQRTLFNLSEEFFCEAVGRDLLTGVHRGNNNVLVRFGRPCWDSLIRDHVKKHRLSKRLGVFCCGPDSLVNSLKKACSRFSSLTKPINVHSEHFNSW
eukprot:jgi/Picsp_1/4172/NSC_01681-R1_nadph oxidase 1